MIERNDSFVFSKLPNKSHIAIAIANSTDIAINLSIAVILVVSIVAFTLMIAIATMTVANVCAKPTLAISGHE